MKKYIVFTIVLVMCTSNTWALVSSPGFEQGPITNLLSFSATDANGLGWFASNTDGERIQTTVAKPANEGSFYASLLQNAGAYNGSPLGIGNFGSTGFDRIYATFAVVPNITYNVAFDHASDNRFGYLAGISVVEIVDVGTNSTITQQVFGTPGLFNWQTETFQFTTNPGTINAAIAFTVMGGANSSGVFDNIMIARDVPNNPNNTAVPEPITATFGLMGLGVLGMATRRRVA